MSTNTKKCPQCAEEIPLAAQTCPHCGTRFEVRIEGYCKNCHTTRQASEAGKCLVCGNDVIDLQIKSTPIAAAPQAGPAQPPSAPSTPQVLEIFQRMGEGVGLRFGTSIIDQLIIAGIYISIVGIIGLIAGAFSNYRDFDEILNTFTGFSLLLLPIIWFLYFTIQEGAFGTTIGKLLGAYPMSFKVIRLDGSNIGFGRAALRALIGIFETNIIGAIVVASTPLKQRLGDLAASTLVVDKTKIRRVEFRPNSALFEFVDGRQDELVRVDKGIITKWLGIPQWMTVNGVNREGRVLKIRGKIIRGATVFDAEPKMAQLRAGLEKTFGVAFKEVLEWWRIVLIAAVLIFGC
ncbi:MAG: RDD family protein, partial [Chloroflexota bacterium]